MSITSLLPAAPGNPAGDAGPPQPPPAGTVPSAAAATADAEVLPVAELLRLLEQGSDFAQALAGAGTGADAVSCPSVAMPGTAAAASQPSPDGAAPTADDDRPCDIATLLRILESQPPPAPSPAAAATRTDAGADPAGGARRRPASSASPASVEPLTDPAMLGPIVLTCPPLPAVAPDVAAAPDAAGAEAATASGAQPPPAPRAPGSDAAITAAGAAASAGIAGELRVLHAARESAIASPADSAAAREVATPAPAARPATADPVTATLALAQSLGTGLPATPSVERTVYVPVRDPAWPQAVAAEIHFLADHQVEVATLRLSPEHLGPLEVRIDVRDSNVSVNFGVTHGDTRVVLEQALPRLRELLAAAGLHLGQATVQQEARRGSHTGGTRSAAEEPTRDGGDGGRVRGVRGVGLVDEYV